MTIQQNKNSLEAMILKLINHVTTLVSLDHQALQGKALFPEHEMLDEFPPQRDATAWRLSPLFAFITIVSTEANDNLSNTLHGWNE
ncbi:hypothetical protein JTB14_009000 [Gonioctena quinquepunctata]|nr:hypothetical protein JTB14_009000 [Gonioctena quinquepunctata]